MAPQQSSTNAIRNAGAASETAPVATLTDPKAMFRENGLGLPAGRGEFAHNRRSIVGGAAVRHDHFHLLCGRTPLEYAYDRLLDEVLVVTGVDQGSRQRLGHLFQHQSYRNTRGHAGGYFRLTVSQDHRPQLPSGRMWRVCVHLSAGPPGPGAEEQGRSCSSLTQSAPGDLPPF